MRRFISRVGYRLIFREDLISQIWQKFAKIAKICLVSKFSPLKVIETLLLGLNYPDLPFYAIFNTKQSIRNSKKSFKIFFLHLAILCKFSCNQPKWEFKFLLSVDVHMEMIHPLETSFIEFCNYVIIWIKLLNGGILGFNLRIINLVNIGFAQPHAII